MRRTIIILATAVFVVVLSVIFLPGPSDPMDQIVEAKAASHPIPLGLPRFPVPSIPSLPEVVALSTTTTAAPTTTTTATPPRTTIPAPVAPPAPPVAPASGGPTDAQLAALRKCESGGNYQSNTPPYYGAYQFLTSTWRSMGTGYDRADHAPPPVQDSAARRLIQRSGWGQFPACSRKIGAR